MQPKILNPTEEALVGIERHWLTNLQIALAQFSAAPEDRAALERSIRQLDELFLLVVVGEFNAGKSAFINALFGQSLLEEGVTIAPSAFEVGFVSSAHQQNHIDATVTAFDRALARVLS